MSEKNKVILQSTMDKPAAISGVIAVVLNLGAVYFLLDTPAVYKPWLLPAWHDAIRMRPEIHAVTSVLFSLGIFSLIPVARALGQRFRSMGSGLGATGALCIEVGALINGAASLLPFVVALYLNPEEMASSKVAIETVSYGLLGVALIGDAGFNLIFGLGILFCSLSEVRRLRGYAIFGIVTGLNVCVVSGQAVSIALARWLGVAGPLWLIWLLWTAYQLWLPSDSEDVTVGS